MKKALTIYVDDDVKLTNYCATFVCSKGGDKSITMQNLTVGDNNAVYLPWKSKSNEAQLFREEGVKDE